MNMCGEETLKTLFNKNLSQKDIYKLRYKIWHMKYQFNLSNKCNSVCLNLYNFQENEFSFSYNVRTKTPNTTLTR